MFQPAQHSATASARHTRGPAWALPLRRIVAGEPPQVSDSNWEVYQILCERGKQYVQLVKPYRCVTSGVSTMSSSTILHKIVRRGTNLAIGCTATGAHQNGSTGPEGTNLSSSAQSLTRQNFISSAQQRSSAASWCPSGFSPSEQNPQAPLMQPGASSQGQGIACGAQPGGFVQTTPLFNALNSQDASVTWTFFIL